MARPIIDLRGRRLGCLTVPRDAQPSIRKRKAYWPCICVCGRRKRICSAHLRRGATVSCGCQRADSQVRKAARRKVASTKGLAVIARLELNAALRRTLAEKRERKLAEELRRELAEERRTEVAALWAEIDDLLRRMKR